jgi:hypothetical protein
MFIRDQAADWCSPEFIEASFVVKPKYLRHGLDPQLDWYAAWRCI